MERGELSNNEARDFVLRANATTHGAPACFTVEFKKTGTRFTYYTELGKPKPGSKWAGQEPLRAVHVLTGPDNTRDYSFLGFLIPHRGRHEYLHRSKRISGNAASVRAFDFWWTRIELGDGYRYATVWHEGRCGRCGRKLTTPKAVKRGLGERCAKKEQTCK